MPAHAALTVADVLLVPVQPRSFDVWALDQVAALVTEAREVNPDLRTLAFLNAADPQGRDNAEAQEALREVAAQGRGVIEQQPRDTKAVDEITALASAAFK